VKIHFWGAAGTVTGSKYFVTHRDNNVLVDCGLFQGLKELRLRNWHHFPVAPSKVEAVILTHAHLDHSGYLPLLVKNGFRGKIYATPATTELCRILLLDSAYLQEEEAKYANRRGYSKHHPAEPLYTREHAELALRQFVQVEFNRTYEVAHVFKFEMIPAGHLLGAASVRLEGGDKSILFSGDLGRSHDPIMKAPQIPRGTDVLVVESTYGDRLHLKDDPMAELKEIVLRTIGRGGTLLIPSFAAGRAQLLLYYLKELRRKNEIPDVPIYLNSPMANSVNGVFRRHLDSHRLGREEAASVCGTAQVVSTPEESKALNNDTEPKIILAASGMASGGRVLHHLKAFAPEAKNSILFAGFQAAGTRGEAMVHGKKEIKIHGELWPIRAEVFNLETLSAHADAEEISQWVSAIRPPPHRIFVTHGEPSALSALAATLRSKLGVETIIPELGAEAEI